MTNPTGRDLINAHRRILEITSRHFPQLPTGSSTADTTPYLTPGELAEYDQLIELITPGGPAQHPDPTQPTPLITALLQVSAATGTRTDHLLTAYADALDQYAALRPGTNITVPDPVTLTAPDHTEQQSPLDTLTDTRQQSNAILTALAAGNQQLAVALMVAFNHTSNPEAR